MSRFVDDLKKRNKEQEQRRTGDIYNECIKQGCDMHFLRSFDSRMWMNPLEQTKAFLEMKRMNINGSNAEAHLAQWKIYLRVMIEKRPNDEKTEDREKALEMLK